WLLALSYLATLTHPLLDWLNTYGIRLLMPLSDRWFYGDALFIIDPWMWLLAGASVVLARTHSPVGKSTFLLIGLLTTALITQHTLAPSWAKIVWWAAVV